MDAGGEHNQQQGSDGAAQQEEPQRTYEITATDHINKSMLGTYLLTSTSFLLTLAALFYSAPLFFHVLATIVSFSFFI